MDGEGEGERGRGGDGDGEGDGLGGTGELLRQLGRLLSWLDVSPL